MAQLEGRDAHVAMASAQVLVFMKLLLLVLTRIVIYRRGANLFFRSETGEKCESKYVRLPF
jgi:hypothetical protein